MRLAIFAPLFLSFSFFDHATQTRWISEPHIAFGSVCMDPMLMILGQSAATSAVLALEAKTTVQSLPYSTLQGRLQDDAQVLEFTPTR
jgi:hypothetical protein